MMDENRLDQLIEENITEARTLWLDTLPHKEEIPRHKFTTEFKLKIRQLAGMKYTFKQAVWLVLMGIYPCIHGALTVALALFFFNFPTRLFTMLFEEVAYGLLYASEVFMPLIYVFLLVNIWYTLGSTARSNDIKATHAVVSFASILPTLLSVLTIFGSAQLQEGLLLTLYKTTIEFTGIFLGRPILGKLFLLEGAVATPLLMAAVFWAGHRCLFAKGHARYLYLMAIPAGVYSAFWHYPILQTPEVVLLVSKWIWLVCAAVAVYKLSHHLLGGRMKQMPMLLVLAILVLSFGMTDLTVGMPAKVPMIHSTDNSLGDVFEDLDTAPVSVKIGEKWVELEPAKADALRTYLKNIDLEELGQIGGVRSDEWIGPVLVRIRIEDDEKPCKLVFCQEYEQPTQRTQKAYKMELVFDNGECYGYSTSDPLKLPLKLLDAIEKELEAAHR